MANRTVTVKSSGGDYTTLNAAFAGEDDTYADLVTNTMILTFDCYNFEDTTAIRTGTAWTVSSSYYLNIVANNSHGGKWSTGSYRNVVSTSSNNYSIGIDENYTRFTGIQSEISSSGDLAYVHNFALGISESPANVLIEKCIIRQGTFSGAVTGGYGAWTAESATVTFINCLFYDVDKASNAFGVHQNGANTINVYNCTFHNCDRGISIANAAHSGLIKNCLFKSCAVYPALAYCGAGSGYNATDVSSLYYTVSGGSTGDRLSQTITFVDEANDDFHLASNDAGALNYGVDLSATFTTDIDGETRPTGAGTWDIGADEYVATGRTTKNTRTNPLGTGTGMAIRMN